MNKLLEYYFNPTEHDLSTDESSGFFSLSEILIVLNLLLSKYRNYTKKKKEKEKKKKKEIQVYEMFYKKTFIRTEVILVTC